MECSNLPQLPDTKDRFVVCMNKLSRERAVMLTGAFAGKRIVVLGDIMLDEFIWGKVRRISPEAPVPVVEVSDETYRLGGSGNVAPNIRAMDAAPISIGIIGQDPARDRLLNLMEHSQIEISGLLRNNRP